MDKSYENYGGRGISVCGEWLENFFEFMKWAVNNGYTDELSIDRIDNNGDYEPSNCRWVTMKKQANNRRSNRIIIYKNEKRTMTEWAQLYGMRIDTLWRRLNRYGMNIEDALTTPLKNSSTRTTSIGRRCQRLSGAQASSG
jgi:hypothetical protein